MFDFHFHSKASDGATPLSEVPLILKNRNLKGFALTDHDHVASSAWLAKQDARAWVGVEFTSKDTGDKKFGIGEATTHVVGVNLNPENKDLKDYLKARTDERRTRFLAYGNKLKELGFTFDPLPETLAQEQLAKPHVVFELVRQSSNKELLSKIGASQENVRPIYGKLLARGAKADISKDVENSLLDTISVIKLIHTAGGLAILAHAIFRPYTCSEGGRRESRWDKALEFSRNKITMYIKAGLDAIELHHPDHFEDFKAEIAPYIKKYNLLTSVGSDDHTLGLTAVGSQNFPGMAEQWSEWQKAKNRYR